MMKRIKCIICGKQLTHKGYCIHLIRHHSKQFTSHNDLVKEVYIRIYSYNTIQAIINDYVYGYLSLPDLKKKYGVASKASQIIIEAYGHHLRTIKEATNLDGVKSKRKQSCIDKYGVENPSQAEIVKHKKAQTFLEHYGVDNIWKAEWFTLQVNLTMMEKYGQLRLTNTDVARKTNLERYGHEYVAQVPAFKEKIKRILLEKYGVECILDLDWVQKRAREGTKARWDNLSDEDKNKQIYALLHNFNSKIEERIQDILLSWQVSFTRNFFIKGYVSSYDFYIPDLNFIIEVQGDFWHANPTKYNADDMMAITNKLAKDIWAKDERKKELATANGYQITYIWENEINKCKNDDDLQELLLNRLGFMLL